jgi:hypothetical protein
VKQSGRHARIEAVRIGELLNDNGPEGSNSPIRIVKSSIPFIPPSLLPVAISGRCFIPNNHNTPRKRCSNAYASFA